MASDDDAQDAAASCNTLACADGHVTYIIYHVSTNLVYSIEVLPTQVHLKVQNGAYPVDSILYEDSNNCQIPS